MNVIGLGCNARVGKDTVANYLVTKHNFIRVSFAEAIRQGIGKGVFGLTDEEMTNDNLKEKAHPYWDKKLHIYDVLQVCEACGYTTEKKLPADRIVISPDCPDCTATMTQEAERIVISPRTILQLAGTEGGRHIFGTSLWVDVAFRQIELNPEKRFVISDVRFPNEAEAILERKGMLFKIDRPAAGKMTNAPNHESERAMAKFDNWHAVIDNSKDFNHLFKQVDSIIVPKLGL